ncbi:MAG: acetamidase/formamidase family protein [Tepidanaerobacteraceae bacterium]|jgi:amidase|nr:acetamidase/formamidase family protein [Thermoanaerobacterales bacterium]
MTFKVSSDNYMFSFSKDIKPILHVEPGDEVEIETMDCFANQIMTNEDKMESLDWNRINPATGPIYVEGAQAGDALKVTIEKIQIGDKGVVATGKDLGVLGHLMESLYSRVLDIKDGQVIFNEHISFPINTMIGVIGVAPKEGSINCGTPGSHGGNMDTKLIKEGSVLYLPVFVDGALFGLGDLHAAMGDGEIGVSGVEVCGSVTVKLELVKNMDITNPIVKTNDVTATIASAISLDKAATIATEDMANLLKQHTSMTIEEIATLMSAVGNLEISQVVDPEKTARFAMPNKILESYNIL